MLSSSFWTLSSCGYGAQKLVIHHICDVAHLSLSMPSCPTHFNADLHCNLQAKSPIPTQEPTRPSSSTMCASTFLQLDVLLSCLLGPSRRLQEAGSKDDSCLS